MTLTDDPAAGHVAAGRAAVVRPATVPGQPGAGAASGWRAAVMMADLLHRPTSAWLDPSLREAIVGVARTPRLLVACDYDGTLAPIVADPWLAYPLPETVAALRSLAILPETTAAVISGRALRELAALSRLPAEVHLVGSHGTEFDVGFVRTLAEPAQALRRKLGYALREVVGDAPGVLLEEKPASVAVHVRQAAAEVAGPVLEAIRKGPGRWGGVRVTEGNAVLELSVIETDKGSALDVVRHQRAG